MSPLPSSINTRWRSRSNVGNSGASSPSSERSTKITSSSAWLTMYVSCSGNNRMFNVCRTRPVQGAAKYSSRWRAVFHANVATRPSSEMPSVSSTPPRRRVRAAQSPYVIRSRPAGVAVTTSLCPKYFSARSNRCVIESGMSCISPFMDAETTARRPDRSQRARHGRYPTTSANTCVAASVNTQIEPFAPTLATNSFGTTSPGPKFRLDATGTGDTTRRHRHEPRLQRIHHRHVDHHRSSTHRHTTTTSHHQLQHRTRTTTTTTSEQPIHRRVRRPRIQQPRRTQRRIPRPRRQVPDDVGQHMRRGIGEHTDRTVRTDLGHQLIRHHITRPEVQTRRHRHRRHHTATPSRTPPPTDPPPSR